MSRRKWAALALLGAALTGCDGKDPERLNRVGKKLVEKGRKLADDAELPQVTISRAKKGRGTGDEPLVEIPGQK